FHRQASVVIKSASKTTLSDLHRRGIREQWSLDRSDFTIDDSGKPFAKGAGGEIYKAIWRELECVAKTCGEFTSSEQNLEDLAHEIAIMSSLRHPHICLFFGACFQTSPPILLMEFCAGGNLESRLIKAFHPDAPSTAKIPTASKWRYSRE